MKKLIICGFVLLTSFSHVMSQSDVRIVDFKNFTYEAFCASDEVEKVKVKNGEFFRETPMDGYVDRFYFKAFDFAYGDLTGDGKEDAVILTVCNTGGTGNFSEGFIFSVTGGKPALIGRIPGGDRANGGLRSARIDKGFLVVESNDVGENGGSCCPEFVITSSYRLRDGKLIEAAPSSRRELYPKERITFARGTSGKTFKVSLPAGEIKRFVVGARSGQTLKVSVDSNKASLRLLEDVETVEGINNFTARLPRSGDFAIEVQNLDDISLQVTLNVKIQ